jgi:hypothetical protein
MQTRYFTRDCRLLLISQVHLSLKISAHYIISSLWFWIIWELLQLRLAPMSQDVLDDWIASLLSTRSNRKTAKLVHVGQDWVRAVRATQVDHTRILHQVGRPTKVRPQIKQTMIELTLQHPNFTDLHTAQIISERFAIPLACAAINYQPNGFTENECRNRWLFLANLKRARYSRIVTYEIGEAMSLFWDLLISQVQYSEGYSWLLGKAVSINCDSHVILVVLPSKVLQSAPDL